MFLDCDGVLLEEQGKFKLSKFRGLPTTACAIDFVLQKYGVVDHAAADDLDEPLFLNEKEPVLDTPTIQADLPDAPNVDFDGATTIGTVDANDGTTACSSATAAGGVGDGNVDGSAGDGNGGMFDSNPGSLPSGSSAPPSTSTLRPRCERKPPWKLRDTVLNFTENLTSALSTTPEGVSPVPNSSCGFSSTITPDVHHNIDSIHHGKSRRTSSSRRRPNISLFLGNSTTTTLRRSVLVGCI